MATMSLQSAYDQTRRWIESNDPERAIGLAQHILNRYPNNLEAYRILGEAYLASRQLDKAQEAFEHVLRADPENIQAHVGLGITYERQGNLERAVPEFEQAWEIKPDVPELRSQLLRVYTDAWGSEHATLRLSRAGLARLYAKGHMLPKAITEFRQVIADQPNRLDARVGLAEALWRDGQENEAIALCREIIAKQPDALKANLILGYLLLAQGKPEGQQYWEAATAIDPQLTVARAMFETMPAAPAEEPTLDEWDVSAWERSQQLARQPVPAATRPIPVAEPARAAAPSFGGDDDFLAVLLGGGTARAAAPAPVENTPPANDMAFSLDEVDFGTTPPASSIEDDTEDFAPFSLADLGLSDDEIDNLGDFGSEPATSTPAPAEQTDDEGTLTPFSLADLGLSDDDVRSLNDVGTQADTTQVDEPAMTPFSLADLGLSDDEIANLNDAGTADEPAMTPFSLADLGLSDDEIANLNDVGTAGQSDEPTLTPFSLADLGLSDDEIANLEGARTANEPTLTPFSLADLGLSDDEIASLEGNQSTRLPFSAIDDADNSELPSDLLPFSFDELDLGDDSSGGLPASLQPFSLDEAPPEKPRLSNFNAPDANYNRSGTPVEDEDETIAQSGGYSWQQPTQRSKPSYLNNQNQRDPLMPEGESIFSKLKYLREKEIEPVVEPSPPAASYDDAVDDRVLFSMDDVSLRDDEQVAAAAAAAAMAAGNQAQTPPEIEDVSSGLSSGDIQPFSLSDLGLSAEEIAGLGLGGDTGAAQNFGSMLDEIPQPDQPAAPEPAQDATESLMVEEQTPFNLARDDETLLEVSGLSPFSLSDLGLSEDEIAALGLEDALDTSSGLGITEEELAGLDMGGDIDLSAFQTATPEQPPIEDAAVATSSSGDPLLDQLLELGHQQGYVDISDIMAGVTNPEEEADRIEQIGQQLHQNSIKIFDGDEEVDMEADYAAEEEDDVSQIDFGEAPAVRQAEEPDMTPFSLADLGLSDEEIAALGLGDMVSATTSEPAAATEPTPEQRDESEMALFSLEDLGLSNDEVVAPVDDSASQAEAVVAPGEPDMAPFSLADLGLSDEEIASLGLASGGEAVAEPVVPAAIEPQQAPEPVRETVPTPGAPLVQTRVSPGLSNSLSQGVPALNGYLQKLEQEPQNHMLRLSLARISGQIGQTEAAIQQYKNIIRQNTLLELASEDLSDLISDTDDPQILQRLHRLLGDAYSKQGRIDEAIAEYNWTYGNHSSPI